MPPHLRRTIYLAYLENGAYDKRIEREMELNGPGAPEEISLTTVYHMKSRNDETIEKTEGWIILDGDSNAPRCEYCGKVKKQV